MRPCAPSGTTRRSYDSAAPAEETLRLESSLKGLEILRKRQKAELQSQEGFFKLSKGQQLILLEKIDREINAKRKALNANKVDKDKEDAEAEKEAAIKRADDLLLLRRQLSDALLENQDDETAKLLKAEEDRYAKQQQLALDNAAKIALDTNASKEDIAESTKLQNEILEQLEIQHYQKLNEITADGLRAELEAQEKSDAERLARPEPAGRGRAGGRAGGQEAGKARRADVSRDRTRISSGRRLQPAFTVYKSLRC